MNSSRAPKSPLAIYTLVTISGLATLSWEVIWQLKATLALGISAKGVALTLAITMGGMCLGSLIMGRIVKGAPVSHPARLYGLLEIIIGLAGLCLTPAFASIEHLDTLAYEKLQHASSLVHIAGITLTLGLPTMCMGATLPVFGLMAAHFRTSIARFYGFNTLGASLGALIAAFVLIPELGVTHAAWTIAAVNILVGFTAIALGGGNPLPLMAQTRKADADPHQQLRFERLIVFVTGFVTFALEIVWFRAFTATFQSTTDVFAIMLTSVLLALGIAAKLVPSLKQKKVPLGAILALAGITILCMTPIVERFDFILKAEAHPQYVASRITIDAATQMISYLKITLAWFILIFGVIGLPMLLLGIALPWILDQQTSPGRWARLYALNTFASILGSLGTAWILLPAIGFSKASWLAGIVTIIAGLMVCPPRIRAACGSAAIAATLIAVIFQSGIGKTRVQGSVGMGDMKLAKVLEYYEGPEATVSAIEYSNGGRALIVDGFVTASQGETNLYDRYMEWMGHLPMLLVPNPKNALVICFGTGQTANAVRQENPESLDIVDINPRVLKLGHNFTANEDVLHDPRVKATVMDGRAYIRRMEKTYDVITLEPMPPNFAGVNSLYSKEFYEFARQRLSDHGVIAQWLPFHLVSPYSSESIVRTFLSVFPNAILWTDPHSKTGVLLGSKDDHEDLVTSWPGFGRMKIKRALSEKQIRDGVFMDRRGLERFGEMGNEITDDNQLLAYGQGISMSHLSPHLKEWNFEILDKIKTDLSAKGHLL